MQAKLKVIWWKTTNKVEHGAVKSGLRVPSHRPFPFSFASVLFAPPSSAAVLTYCSTSCFWCLRDSLLLCHSLLVCIYLVLPLLQPSITLLTYWSRTLERTGVGKMKGDSWAKLLSSSLGNCQHLVPLWSASCAGEPWLIWATAVVYQVNYLLS